MANEIAFAKRTFRSLVRSLAVLSLYAGAGSAVEAAVNRQSRAISSANVNISVSVAPRHTVQITAMSAVQTSGSYAASNGFCIVSNAAPVALPTMLMFAGGMTTIDRCGSTTKSQVGDPKPLPAPISGLVLIRPE